ncbi:NACHT domain-containing protein [Actinoallomurus sp. NPDC050550]|uniref:NACHT domain-containing protein n=1 Tax=Actinoallomurus sp. NPDC050550 TaxID=3154937 RepID=UPI0033F8BBBE
MRREPGGAAFRGQRLSEWIADTPGRATVPDDPDSLLALVTVLGRWAGDPRVDEGRWRTLLDEARDVPRDPGRRDTLLRRYLTAVANDASAHPYPAVVENAFPPPLSQVYLRPHLAEPDARAASSGQDQAGGRMPAQDVVDMDEDCLVVGGPGMGKSSLLRQCVLTLTRRPAGEVPVRILAADLLGPGSVAELIANAVRRDLSGHEPRIIWSPEFFAVAPAAGARWLLLVDGLDEIVGVTARREVVEKLAALARENTAPGYRIILTTRPLSGLELDSLLAYVRWRPVRWEIQPFTPDDIHVLAVTWYRALELPGPELMADRFVALLSRMRLTELAATPLMASIMCQLHALLPDAELPRTRGEIYYRFTLQLHRRLNSDGESGVRAQTHRALRRYGDDATTRADRTLDRLPELITALAVRRRAGDTAPALEIVATHALAACPASVPAEDWRSVLDSALRRSGLLDIRRGDFELLHQTLADYLIARHHLDRMRTIREIFALRRHRRYVHWSAPRQDPSLLGFVLDPGTWGQADETLPADLEQAALELVTSGRLEGCRFLAAQRRLGTGLPPSVVAKMREVVEHLIDSQSSVDTRVQAARILADLDRDQGLAALEGLAAIPSHIDPFAAARGVAALDIARGTRLLCAMAENVRLRERRVDAARLLAQLDPLQGAQRLAAIARDRPASGSMRVAAARSLLPLDPLLAAELLEAQARDESSLAWDRAEAAFALVTVNLGPGASLLETAVVEALRESDRVLRANAEQAVRRLVEVDPQRAVALVHERLDERPSRRDRAWLTKLATDLLQPVVPNEQDTEPLEHSSAWITIQLAHLTPIVNSPDYRRGLIASPEHNDRLPAGLAPSLDDPRAADLLYKISNDTNLRPTQRLIAACQLARFGDPRATALLTAYAEDPSFGLIRNISAARWLAAGGDELGMALLERIARGNLGLFDRLKAIEGVAALDRDHALSLLHEIRQDRPFWRLDQALVLRLARKYLSAP